MVVRICWHHRIRILSEQRVAEHAQVEVGHLSQPPKIILLPIILKGASQRIMPPKCLLLIRTQLIIVRLSIALKWAHIRRSNRSQECITQDHHHIIERVSIKVASPHQQQSANVMRPPNPRACKLTCCRCLILIEISNINHVLIGVWIIPINAFNLIISQINNWRSQERSRHWSTQNAIRWSVLCKIRQHILSSRKGKVTTNDVADWKLGRVIAKTNLEVTRCNKHQRKRGNAHLVTALASGQNADHTLHHTTQNENDGRENASVTRKVTIKIKF